MIWDPETIRDLRLRMGWSQSDLARRLEIQSNLIEQWEMGLIEVDEDHTQRLDLLHRQAEVSAEQLTCESLAEILFDESTPQQVDIADLRSKFRNNQ